MIRIAALAALAYFVWRVWPGDGLLAFVLMPMFVYAAWQAVVLPLNARLLSKRWESTDSARRSVAVVALLGLPRLLWAVPIALREREGTMGFVVVASATMLIAVSAVTLWVCVCRHADRPA